MEIISYSVNIDYRNDHFQPDYQSLSNTLSTLQARYDRNHGMINQAWGKVKYCKLINRQNNRKMRNKDTEINNYLVRNNHFRHVDWARNRDFAIRVCNYFTNIFEDSYVKAELKMLQIVNTEMRRLKRTYPDDFYRKQRYLDISKALKELENCSRTEIPNIASRYHLLY